MCRICWTLILNPEPSSLKPGPYMCARVGAQRMIARIGSHDLDKHAKRHTHRYRHTHARPHAGPHIPYTHACMHACIHAFIHVYMHTQMYTYIYSFIHSFLHRNRERRTHARARAHTHAQVVTAAKERQLPHLSLTAVNTRRGAGGRGGGEAGAWLGALCAVRGLRQAGAGRDGLLLEGGEVQVPRCLNARVRTV